MIAPTSPFKFIDRMQAKHVYAGTDTPIFSFSTGWFSDIAKNTSGVNHGKEILL